MSDNTLTRRALLLPDTTNNETATRLINEAISRVETCGGREIVLRWRQRYWHEGTGEDGDTSTWFVPVREDEVVWVEVEHD